MPFASGSVSFQRFAVVGDGPSSVTEELLEKARDHAVEEHDGVGPVEDEAWGWCGGRHLLDSTFSFENNVYNDALHLGLRVETNKPPGDLRRAYAAVEEQANVGPSGFASKAAKKDARDAADRRLDELKKEGRFRKSRMTPVLWDVGRSTVYGPASASQQDKLFELFDRSFGLSLVPLTSGNLALRRLETTGRRREYEDARPTRFALGPHGEQGQAEYPWVAKGPQAKDFLGNEFLLWLWHAAEHDGGGIELSGGNVVTAFVDKSLDLDCVYGATGRGSLRGDGPGRMPEARQALRVGKAPRKLGLVLDAGEPFSLTLSGESLAIGGLALPDVDDADSPRQLFEERVTLLRDFCQTLDGLFDAFLKVRAGGGWPGRTSQIRDWITRHAPPLRKAA